jgi:hypothetical protein
MVHASTPRANEKSSLHISQSITACRGRRRTSQGQERGRMEREINDHNVRAAYVSHAKTKPLLQPRETEHKCNVLSCSPSISLKARGMDNALPHKNEHALWGGGGMWQVTRHFYANVHTKLQRHSSLAALYISGMQCLIHLYIQCQKTNSVAWVRERTTLTERPQLVGEVIANFCG